MSISPTIIGLWSIIVWSLSVVVAAILVNGFGALRACGIEFTLSGVILLVSAVMGRRLKNLSQHSWSAIILPGIFFILNLATFYAATGSARTPLELVIVGLLNYLWPITTLVFSIPINGAKPTKWLFPGVVLGFVGIVVAKADGGTVQVTADNWNPIAYGLAIVAAITWGVYSNLARKLSHPNGGSLLPLYLILGGALIFIASLVVESNSFHPSKSDWLVMLAWSIAGATALISWDFGMRKGDVATISSCSMSVPVLSTVWTMLYSGIGLDPRILLASILVVVGSVFAKQGVVAASREK